MNKVLQEKISNIDKEKLSREELSALAANLRLTMFDILQSRQTGHWGGASSSTEITTALYFNRMNIRPEDPAWAERDRLILSKGHASVNLYTMLATRGFFDTADLPSFRVLGSHLQGHPSMKKTPGVDMSTGALGHGLSIGVGMALASTLQGNDYFTYVLSGEGCLNEGQTWEAVMSAAKFRPKKLVYMIDYNKVQLDGTSNEIMPLDPLADKFKDFGWNVAPKTYDGHDMQEILDSFDWIDSDDVWPKLVVYNTVKGKGVSFMEGLNKWHGSPIDADSYAQGRPELVADIERKEAVL
ncbi:MAG: transketolase [Sphaerochaetaceae bacterium]|nr:transketolase [Sphaerochaetaceae bacterium]